MGTFFNVSVLRALVVFFSTKWLGFVTAFAGSKNLEEDMMAGPEGFAIATDTDYRIETLQVVMDQFKTNIRKDFASTFASVETKTRMIRNELVEHLYKSLEELESRMSSQQKDLYHQSQLADIDFRKALKGDIYALRSATQGDSRKWNAHQEEVGRMLKLHDSYYRELKLGIDSLTNEAERKRRNGGLDLDLMRETKALRTMMEDHSMAVKTQMAVVRKDAEQRHLDAHQQLVQLHKVIDNMIRSEERGASVRDEQQRLMFEEIKTQAQDLIRIEQERAHDLFKEMRLALDAQTDQVDFLASQVAACKTPLSFKNSCRQKLGCH